MNSILICLNNNPTPELLDAILIALSQGGVEYIASDAGGVTVISPAEYPAQLTDTVPDVPDVANVQAVTVDLPQDHQFKVDLPDEVAIELPLASPEQPSLTVPVNEPVNAQPICDLPNVIIKSLSLMAQVKAVYDPEVTGYSYLKALDVKLDDVGFIKFKYAGVEYRYPCDPALGTISVIVSFTGKEQEQFPCLLQVFQIDSGIEELVFGTNEYSLVQQFIS